MEGGGGGGEDKGKEGGEWEDDGGGRGCRKRGGRWRMRIKMRINAYPHFPPNMSYHLITHNIPLFLLMLSQ